MNFQVPQFIETEDKIIGPLTIKQFLYLAAAGGISFILYFFLETFLWIVVTFIVGTAAVSLAFIKINGQSLMKITIAALNFYWKPHFYLWKREKEAEVEMKITEPESLKISKTEQVKSKLDNLWQQLKTSKQPVPKREKTIAPAILDRVRSSKERFEMMRKITGEKEVARRVDYR